MKFLRILTNSLLSGSFFSLLLSLLVLDLNLNVAFNLVVVLKLAAFLMITYGLLAALVCLIVTAVYRFFAAKKPPVPFVSPSFLTLSLSALTLLFLIIFRENYMYFLSFFVPGLQSLLKIQMLVLFILAVTGLVLHYQYHHHKPRPIYFGSFFLLLACVLALALWQRQSFPAPQKAYRLANLEAKAIDKRVTILYLEGLSLDLILPAANENKLPNFSWLMKEGAWGRLQGFTPSDRFVLTSAFYTGKFPGKNRQISDVKYKVPGLREEIEVVPRYILFRQMKRLGILQILPNDAAPAAKDLWRILHEYGATTLRFDLPSLAQISDKPNPKTDKLFKTFFPDPQDSTAWIFTQVRQAFFRDAEAEDEAFLTKQDEQPQVFSLLLDGANTAEMYFYKYSFPAEFGDIRQDEIQKYGTVIEKYYEFFDQIISKYLAALREGEVLVVISPFGTAPLPFWKRFVEWGLGNAQVSAYHEQAPEGAFFFYAKGVIARGKPVDPIRLVDITPTILYYMGLPVGKDMDGVVRGALFEPDFTEENPVLTIASHEDAAVRRK